MQRNDSIIQSVGLITGSSVGNSASVSSLTCSMHGQAIGESSPTPGTSSASWISPGLELRFSSSPTPSGSSMVSSSQSMAYSTQQHFDKPSRLTSLNIGYI